MSSTSGELNALASTTSVDFYKRILKNDGDAKHYLKISKLLTLAWGLLAVFFALFANAQENLIEAVNIIGSLFYGTILGIFLVAFFFKFVEGTAVFLAAIIAEFFVLNGYFFLFDISYLLYNVIGAVLTILLAVIIQWTIEKRVS